MKAPVFTMEQLERLDEKALKTLTGKVARIEDDPLLEYGEERSQARPFFFVLNRRRVLIFARHYRDHALAWEAVQDARRVFQQPLRLRQSRAPKFLFNQYRTSGKIGKHQSDSNQLSLPL